MSFNPDQPRDSDGKWSGGGSGGSIERIASQHLGVDSLVPQGRDSADFHTVSVTSVRAALGDAAGGISNREAEKIAAKHLGIDSLTPQGRDSLDFHEVNVEGIRSALTAAVQTRSDQRFSGRMTMREAPREVARRR